MECLNADVGGTYSYHCDINSYKQLNLSGCIVACPIYAGVSRPSV